LPIPYLVQEFVVDGILQVDSSYIPPSCINWLMGMCLP
jgi:hypothetical protein